MIKFGIMAMPQHPRTDSPVTRFRETVELTRLARDAGLDSIACGQHFLAPPYQNIQSLPLLSRLAAESGSMSLVLSVILLPLYSPVGLAEDVASLDVISEGRAVFGVGLGYRDIEYQGFNTRRRDRIPRFEGVPGAYSSPVDRRKMCPSGVSISVSKTRRVRFGPSSSHIRLSGLRRITIAPLSGPAGWDVRGWSIHMPPLTPCNGRWACIGPR